MKNTKAFRLAALSVAAFLSVGAVSAQGVVVQDPNPRAKASRVIPDRYIVTLKPSVVEHPLTASSRVMAGANGRVDRVFDQLGRGFSAHIPAAALSRIRNHPLVESVEPDQTVEANQAISTQTGATWGLDRVNQRALPLDAAYSFASRGQGVAVYVVDTGILPTHADFGGRVAAGYSAISDGYGSRDCNGHGTHVAGSIGGGSFGVAKGVNLVPVRVLDCAGSGTSSGVIAGLNWIASVAAPGSVVNMSLGGGASASLDSAVNALINKGLTVVVAAGNSNVDACTQSPARVPAAITVGATSNTDARASFSNFGTCLDLFAPGVSITAPWYTGDTALARLSGTSMAAPHVAGAAALVSALNPGKAPSFVSDTLRVAATAGRVTSAGTGSPNLLLYSLPTSVTYSAVQSIAGSRVATSTSWTPQAVTKVYNPATGSVLAGQRVSGRFSNGASGSCTTSTAGTCMISGSAMSLTVNSVTFTVIAVTGSTTVYDGKRNLVNTVTISRF